jgi:hypothetical protein
MLFLPFRREKAAGELAHGPVVGYTLTALSMPGTGSGTGTID